MSVSFDQGVMEGLDASKPAASAGTVGRLYFATDTGKVYRDNGSAWVERANDLQLGTTATTAAAGNDSRLSDARTPTAHHATHEVGGSDPLTGVVPGSAFAPAGLTGAVAASRYVGATTSGAPTTGTFAKGDFIIAQTGTLWVCTTAGSPGTWTQITGGGGGGTTIVARVYHSLAQACASGAFTTLNFDSEREDTDTIHDTVTNNSRLTCKTAGRYLIHATVQLDQVPAGSGRFGPTLVLNATTPLARNFGSGAVNNPAATVSTVYTLAVNDYVEVQLFQETGSSKNTLIVANSSPEFGMIRLGA